MTLHDNHMHIINEATTPPEVAAGRWKINRSEMKAIMAVSRALRGIDWPDEVDMAAEIVDRVLGFVSPKYRRIRHLIALYFMSTEKQVRLVRKMLRSNGVAGANVLLVPGTPARGVREVLGCCAGTELGVFVPYEWADEDGVSGIKHYPSLLRGPYMQAADAACALDLPIISHCSPGGIRDPGVTAARAKYLNAPERWLEILRDRPIRLCLAHGGGGKWATWMAGPQTELWTMDYMMREACPPTDWAGRLWIDTAFHENQGSDQYKRAVARAGAPWRVRWGSDWPLHLPEWSYSQACDWGRAYWGGTFRPLSILSSWDWR
ncbi:MAG: hypothetical protein EOM20_19530 [Spartobacteria bacterium]|nr:hypothetical protein [Spartobacteria bacterium]